MQIKSSIWFPVYQIGIGGAGGRPYVTKNNNFMNGKRISKSSSGNNNNRQQQNGITTSNNKHSNNNNFTPHNYYSPKKQPYKQMRFGGSSSNGFGYNNGSSSNGRIVRDYSNGGVSSFSPQDYLNNPMFDTLHGGRHRGRRRYFRSPGDTITLRPLSNVAKISIGNGGNNGFVGGHHHPVMAAKRHHSCKVL